MVPEGEGIENCSLLQSASFKISSQNVDCLTSKAPVRAACEKLMQNSPVNLYIIKSSNNKYLYTRFLISSLYFLIQRILDIVYIGCAATLVIFSYSMSFLHSSIPLGSVYNMALHNTLPSLSINTALSPKVDMPIASIASAHFLVTLSNTSLTFSHTILGLIS